MHLCVLNKKEMENRIFKTNIMCGSCIEKATDTLNAIVGEGNWVVDTTLPLKPLTITEDTVPTEKIMASLGKIGFTAVPL